ncbi:MAG: 4'-phosphopantetheinyl transferase superfamily protein [Pirellulales bacterium]|nr:4'-phosphopantetheinyl transferase superfamily protein [Pirellulales bacterium]
MAKQTFSNCPHVTIACLSLEVTEKEYAYLVTLLSDEEKERSLRRVPEVRRRAVVSRGYLRVLLGSLTGVSPEKVSLATGDFGKPYITDPGERSIQFNVAHSMDDAVIALSRQCVLGVDVEKRKLTHDQRWARMMAHTIFSDVELVDRVGLSGAFGPEEILDFWVAKEAVFKAIGTGIGDKLRACQLPSELPKLKMSIDSVISTQQLAPVTFKEQSYLAGDLIGTTLINLGEGSHLAVACPTQFCKLAVRSFDSVLEYGLVEE